MRKVVMLLSLILDEKSVADLIDRAIVSRNTGTTVDLIELQNGPADFKALVELTLPNEATEADIRRLVDSHFLTTEHWRVQPLFAADDSKLADLRAKVDGKLPIPIGVEPKQIDAELADIKAKLGKT